MIKNKLLYEKIASFSQAIKFASKGVLQRNSKRTFSHIKDMEKENFKAQMQKQFDESSKIEVYAKIYKPTYTLEFNRVGELLLYSCNPLRHREVYLKYPYVFYESLSPLLLFMFIENPFHLSWATTYLFFFGAQMLWFPRAWYLNSMQYRIKKMWLLRGGKVIKFERETIAGDKLTNWVEVQHFRPLTEDFKEFEDEEADFLNEEGQLKYELGTELEHFRQWSVTEQDVNVFFLKEGIVHQPEVFEAVVKAYHVDTTDFVINTALDDRTREPNFSH